MALRKLLSKRLSNTFRFPSPSVTLSNPSLLSPPKRDLLSSPDSGEKSFFRRFLHRKAISGQIPDFLTINIGSKLREKIKGVDNSNSDGDRLRLDGLLPPVDGGVKSDLYSVSLEDAKRLMRVTMAEKVKAKLKESNKRTMSYVEFVEVCVNECCNYNKGLEFAKILDESGDVLVWGNIVFLDPHQLAKSMEKLISETIAAPNDPRRAELEQMEKQKAIIDKKARALVKGELYCGFGFLVVQTLGFMRLTFWELNWDVMEPICFFVTSLHFALGYGFFLRTSTEPSFEGYFNRRFQTKQEKLMKIHKFDVYKFNQLREMFYPRS